MLTRRAGRTWAARLTLLGLVVSTGLVLPTLSSSAPAAPGPVATATRQVAFGTPRSAAPARPGARPQRTALASSVGTGFDLVAVTFDRAVPTGTTVQLRTRSRGAWSGWVTAPTESDASPDRGTAEFARSRSATEPVIAPSSDAVEVRLSTTDDRVIRGARATLVDGGTSAADGPAASGAVATAAVAQPTIIPRSQWGADESLRQCDPGVSLGYQAGIVHHTVNSNTYTSAEVPAILRSILAFHTKTRGWCDAAYQFFVDRFGRVFEGRYGSIAGQPIGGATMGFNARTVAVSAVGDFTTAGSPSAMRSAIIRTLAWQASKQGYDPSAKVTLTSAGNDRYAAGVKATLPRTMAHRDTQSTGCPGDNLYSYLTDIRTAVTSLWKANGPTWLAVEPTAATETYPAPASGPIALTGRGYGHGIGMSQWGAHGAATQGLTWPRILAFYYPGTTLSTIGNPSVRVELTAVGTAGTTVLAQSGLALRQGTTKTVLPTATDAGAPIERWRLRVSGTGLQPEAYAAGAWTAHGGVLPAPVGLLRPDGTVRVQLGTGTSFREYPGEIVTQVVGTATRTVDVLPMEDYVAAVTPSEMPPSWQAEALKAQSVAARSFAERARKAPRNAHADVCDTTACQVYFGLADWTATGSLVRQYSDARATAAAAATAGQVVWYSGAVALTQFSSSNGGRMVAGSTPYLVAKDDPYDGVVAGGPQRWSTTLTAASVQAAYPAIGTLSSVTVTGRDGAGEWRGRMAGVTLKGSLGSVSPTAADFRTRLGLRSTWWTITSAAGWQPALMQRDLTGNGLGDIVVRDGDRLQVLAGGQLRFTPTVLAAKGWTGRRVSVGVGAFDNDTLGDVLSISTDGTLWRHPGVLGGTLGSPVSLGTGWGGTARLIATGDLDGDRLTDVIALGTDGVLTRLLGDGAGGIRGRGLVGTGFRSYPTLVAADANGDRNVDLVGVRSTDGALMVFTGRGDGTFTYGARVGTADWRWATSIASVGDQNGDGRDDLVLRRGTDGRVFVQALTGDKVLGSRYDLGISALRLPWAG